MKSPLLLLLGTATVMLVVWLLSTPTMDLAMWEGLAIALSMALAKLLQMGIETKKLRSQMVIMQSQVSLLNRQVADLKAEAWHDKLTGLGNRNLLEDRVAVAKERAIRNGTTFALFMIDLNEFKSINDRYGHAAGDEVLVTVASRLSAAVRGSDTVIRLGGDEFVILAEDADRSDGFVSLGKKLMTAFSEDVDLPSHELVHVGASMGMARFPDDGVEMVELLDLADQGMYESKASTRIPLGPL